MVSGEVALALLAAAVAGIVVLTGRFRLNAFLVLVGVAFAFGLAIGLPPLEVVGKVKAGFGGTLTSIGIVIVAGTIMGTVLEKTGAALSMTQAILRLVGRNRAPLAMNAAGYVVSVPVFCDSGFVLLNPLNRALARETGTPRAVMAVALATGLYATHTLVPPTPGPIAAAGALGADLGRVILLGLLAAIPASLAGLAWARLVAARHELPHEEQESYSEILRRCGSLPSASLSFVPIVLPIALILLKSVAELPSQPFGGGRLAIAIRFVGDPVVALLVGMGSSFLLVRGEGKGESIGRWMGEGIRDSAIILVITAAGGSFGAIIAASPIVDFIRGQAAQLSLGILLPFVVAAALKTAQGSSTVAIVTTSNLLAPMLAQLGLDPALTVLAIGSGSMVVSHANDSYFWVVSQFSGMPVSAAYKIYSSATLVEGLAGLAAVATLSFLF